jgi:hypothetical protein
MCKERTRQEWFLLFETWRTRGWFTRLADQFWNFGFFRVSAEVLHSYKYLLPYSEVMRHHGYNADSVAEYLNYVERK